MIQQIMCVYDSKARAHLVPFFVANIELGIRAFEGAANDPTHELARHPEDFTLLHLGEFNDENAEFSLKPRPVNLGLARQYQRTPKEAELLNKQFA